jgi:GWxTD domain-containing protein
MKKLLNILFLTLSLGVCQSSYALPPVPIYIKAQVVDKMTTQEIFLSINIPRLEKATSFDNILVTYWIKAAPNSNEILKRDTVSLANAQKEGTALNVSVEIPATGTKTAMITVKVTDQEVLQEAQEEFFLGAGNNFPALLSADNNTLIDYALPKENLKFLSNDQQTVFVYRIKQDFLPAQPPMQTDGVNTTPELKVDSSFQIKAGEVFQLREKGLYFAQLDTNSVYGFGFRVTADDFPKYKTVYNLIEPLVYISDYSEISPMQRLKQEDAYGKKLALDQYWLNLAKDETKAKRMIKLYYQRVSEANRYFTTYKEGWRTDMGMVYIVFGRPESIIRFQGQEQWLYRYYGQDIRLTFVKRNNQFTRQHYELVRDAKLKEVWYEMVERWRLGLVVR